MKPHPMTPLLGIIDECDAPQADMVCVLMGARVGFKWEYVDRRKQARNQRGHVKVKPAAFTPLIRFGVLPVYRADGALRFEPFGPSTATYEDGKPRRWQGEGKPDFVFVRYYVATSVLRAVEAMQLEVHQTLMMQGGERMVANG